MKGYFSLLAFKNKICEIYEGLREDYIEQPNNFTNICPPSSNVNAPFLQETDQKPSLLVSLALGGGGGGLTVKAP